MDIMDEQSIIYYESQPVLYIEENFDGDIFETDTRAFIVYDKDDNVFCLYGSRKCDKRKKYVNYFLKYNTIDDLYNYLLLAMNTKVNTLNITTYYFSDLTSNDTFDDFSEKTNKYKELFGYDNIKLNRKAFYKFINVLNTGSSVDLE
jgi:hypothetical protein